MASANGLAFKRGKHDIATFWPAFLASCKINDADTILIPLFSTTKQLKKIYFKQQSMHYISYLFYINVYSHGKREMLAKKEISF